MHVPRASRNRRSLYSTCRASSMALDALEMRNGKGGREGRLGTSCLGQQAMRDELCLGRLQRRLEDDRELESAQSSKHATITAACGKQTAAALTRDVSPGDLASPVAAILRSSPGHVAVLGLGHRDQPLTDFSD